MDKETLAKLTEQVSEGFVQQLYDNEIRPRLLERLSSHYEGASQRLLNDAIRRYGGRYHCRFRLGSAGFSGGSGTFSISFDYWDSEHKVVEPRCYQSDEVAQELILRASDIETIVASWANHILIGLEKWL